MGLVVNNMIDIIIKKIKNSPMIKTIKRYAYNFTKYMSIKNYMDNHPQGRYPNFFKRLYIFWIFKNEPTYNEWRKEWI
jgi:hypothetical protein